MDAMDELQQIIVADHIRSLRSDGRDPADVDEDVGRALGRETDPADKTGQRVRIGRWLIGVGSAIAGEQVSRDGSSDTAPRPI
jgi:hypothetical protein